jgi:hypothetical protein
MSFTTISTKTKPAIILAAATLLTPFAAQGQTDPSAPAFPEAQRNRAPEPETSMSQEEFYARDYGVSVGEARRRFAVMRQAGELSEKMRNEQAATFAGTEIVHAPQFRVKVKFTGDADGRVRGMGLPSEFVGEAASETENEVKDRQIAIDRALKAKNIRYASAIRADGTIDIYTEAADSPNINGNLTSGGVKGVGRTRVKTVPRIKESGKDLGEAAALLGGNFVYDALKVCTAGFTVYKISATTTRYKTTAGHCPDVLWAPDQTPLPFVAQKIGVNTPYDIQWHSQGTFPKFTNTVKNGATTTLAITAIVPPSRFQIGQYLCKYGYATYKTCGNVVSLSYNLQGIPATFVQVHSSTGANLSDPGDSGAPWFSETYSEAWGSHSESGYYPDDIDAIFMPVKYFEDAAIGLRVLTTP